MLLNNDINRASSTKLLKLVLALHRKKLVDIPDAGHTEGILLLLRIANGDSELLAWATEATGADAEEIRVSCVAFVERVCFNGDANPFGVLGLNPWANAEAVKEHYRLLIRIFHPDRGQVSNTTAEAYSARINQAYAVLKQQVGDDAGDLSRRTTASYRGQPSVIPRRFSRPVNTNNDSGDSLRWASRLTPAKVLFVMALLAGLIIYFAFPQKTRSPLKAVDVVNKSQIDVPDAGLTPVEALAVAELATLPEVVSNHRPAEIASTIEEKQADTPEQLAIVAKPVKAENTSSLTKPLVKTAAAVAVDSKKTKVVAVEPNIKTPDIKPAITKSAEIKPVNKTEAVQPAVIAAPSNVMQSPAEIQVNKKSNSAVNDSVITAASEIPVQPRIVTPKPVDMITDRELHDIITGFMSHYANGDIDAFMQVFDEQVRSDEEGGKSGLYSAYADLFANTASRSIVLKDLQWKKQGAAAVAQADYRANIQRTGEMQAKSSFGTLQIEVVKRGGRAVISGFFYQVAKK